MNAKISGVNVQEKDGISIASKYYLPNLLRTVVLLIYAHRSFNRPPSRR